MKKRNRQYALYKGDDFITSGTMREIADKTSKTFDHIYFMSSPAYKRRTEARRLKRGITNSLEPIEIEED